eukprot:285800-Rhodomonas_salina.2
MALGADLSCLGLTVDEPLRLVNLRVQRTLAQGKTEQLDALLRHRVAPNAVSHGTHIRAS